MYIWVMVERNLLAVLLAQHITPQREQDHIIQAAHIKTATATVVVVAVDIMVAVLVFIILLL
jgi:hypothetical protein